MENEINDATAYSTHLKKQNSTLLSANNKRESIDNIQPEHERLCERYRKLQKMIYGMESRAIVYSDYIDEMKEALDKEQSSTARRLLDLAPTPWYYFDTRGYAPSTELFLVIKKLRPHHDRLGCSGTRNSSYGVRMRTGLYTLNQKLSSDLRISDFYSPDAMGTMVCNQGVLENDTI
ncbi:hypothetical protein BZA77DRAFT_291874 [Pyronema omphalodes]|nr:hypothetical protein BZA77DRAFT_296898 [Pyronema omphalodes]KAI5817944.1 hypothetical protein BZA77DRAFT_291874 [Pyronema omphalodes]